jgi:peptidoglycan hydrolase-like protein with peptidoglycan-binding domain
MVCERIRRPQLLLALLLAIAVALSVPAAGHAAEHGKLEFAGVLERGSGYGTGTGSDPVRMLQRRLRQLGVRPGPVDGFYGPLTQSAVERFQQRHGLAVDGIVGRKTTRWLNAPAGQPATAPAHHETQPGNVERKSPAPQVRAESAGEVQSARPAPAGVASRAAPDAGTGIPPEAVALVAALAGLFLVMGLSRRREASVNFGLVCAALLGVFGIGAAAGAMFATEAAPDGVDEATAQTGALLGQPATADRASATRVRRARVARAKPRVAASARSSAGSASAPASSTGRVYAAPPSALAKLAPAAPAAPAARPRSAAPARAAPAPTAPESGRTSPVQRAAPVTSAPVTYVVQPGDSLSNIAMIELGAGSSGASLEAAVAQLAQLNLDGRIRSGDPNVLEAGEELRLR